MTFDFGADSLRVSAGDDGTLQGETFPGRNGQIFGGQISAQSVSAAALEVAADARPHSLHLTYLSAGDPSRPLDYVPVPVRLGRSFSVIRVDVRQGDRHIATSTVSFHGVEDSEEHGLTAHAAPAPDECAEVDLELLGGHSPVWVAVDSRLVSIDAHGEAPSMRMWMRWNAQLPDDPPVHAGAAAWMSDLLIVRTARLRISAEASRPNASSLDHSVWFHRDFDANDWLLMESTSLVRTGARALGEVRMFARNGNLVATAKQECLVR